MQSKKVFLIFILLLFLILSKSLVFFAAETDYPALPTAPSPTPEEGLPSYVHYIFNLALTIGGLVAFGVLIWGGVLYLTSAGNPEQIGNAKKKLLGAFLGLLILFAVYLILTTINPDLISLHLPALENSQEPSDSPTTTPQEEKLVFKEIPLGTIAENILAGNFSCFDKDRNLIDCQPSECVINEERPGQYICQKGQKIQDSVADIFSSDTDFRYCYQYDVNGNKEKLLENVDQYQCLQNLIDAIKIKTQKLIDLSNELNSLLKSGCGCLNCSTGWCKTRSSGGCSYCDSHCSCCGNPRGTQECNPSEGVFRSGYDPCRNRKAIDIKREEINILLGTNLTTNYDDAYKEDVYKKAKENLIENVVNNENKFLTLAEAKRRLEGIKGNLQTGLDDLKAAEDLMKNPYGKRLTLAEYFRLKEQSPKLVQKEGFKNYQIEKYCYYFNCKGTQSNGLCNSCSLSEENRMCQIETANNTSVEDYVFSGDPATFYLIKQCKEYENKDDCESADCNWSTDGCWGDTGQEYLEEIVFAGGKGSLETEEEKGFIKSLIPIGETIDETEVFTEKVLSYIGDIDSNLQSIIETGGELYGLPEQCECSRCSNSKICEECGCCRPCHCDEPPCGCCASDDCCRGCTNCKPNQGGADYYVCPIDTIETDIKNIKIREGDEYIDLSSINEARPESKTTFTIDLDPKCGLYTIQLLDPCDTINLRNWLNPNTYWLRLYKKATLKKDGGSLDFEIKPGDPHWIDYSDPDRVLTETSNYWQSDRQTIQMRRETCQKEGATFYLNLGEVRGTVSPKLEITLETNYPWTGGFYFLAKVKKSCPGYLQSIEFTHQRFKNLIEVNLEEYNPNRCTLMDKLTLSRDRLEKCISGYGVAFKETLPKRIFSSKISLDLVYLGKWIILPDFPYPPLTEELNVYPYNSSTLSNDQKEVCRINKDSSECLGYTKDLLENYYCIYE